MTKKTYHHGDLAAELLRNARQLIDAGHALTMRKVAAMSGVSATAAYRHFADKEALLAGVLENAFYELAAQLETARRDNDNPIDSFFNVGRVMSGAAIFALRWKIPTATSCCLARPVKS